MNPQRSLRSSAIPSSRAAFSPLFRNAAQRPLTRANVNARLVRAYSATVPTADTLTPATPSLVERWWDPHLVDRLQTPLTRIHE
jgi:hypothetical protein